MKEIDPLFCLCRPRVAHVGPNPWLVWLWTLSRPKYFLWPPYRKAL